MSAVFLSPFAFFALSAVPVLAAIYLFRSRFQPLYVSTLMFWHTSKKPRQGGLHLRRIQTPLLFFIELLLVILLVLAAAGPAIRSMKDTRHIVIVLDDSFSMLASGERTPRETAIKAIEDLLAKAGRFDARFILAGTQPRLLDVTASTVKSASALLDNWRCLGQASDLEKANVLASELAGKTARILVITDHSPKNIIQQDSLEWRAFGRSLPNTAFVSATRTTVDTKDNCMLAVANFADRPAAVNVIVEKADSSQIILSREIEIQENAVERIFFEVSSESPPLRAHIQPDFLQIDDQVILTPEPAKPLRVRIAIGNEMLASAVQKAVEAVNFAQITTFSPHLLITDSAVDTSKTPDAWMVQIIAEQNAVAFTGPFILDRTHPVTGGLSLDGVIWGAAEKTDRVGVPVIAAGNVPLVTDRETTPNTHYIRINLNPAVSTLTRSPNWPILLYNIIRWRQSLLSGLKQANFALGDDVTFLPESSDQPITLINPAGEIIRMPADSQIVSLKAETPGLYILTAAGRQHPFAVNALSNEESNLTAASSGKWGKWQEANLFWWEYRSVDWLILLVAMALLTLHSLITTGRLGE
ncbi:MAG: VWA domain-containing protein [Sedimentisphaerales bacterium]|nr:VWA domain-containing protein [Sedimentisphaerales bacterium]